MEAASITRESDELRSRLRGMWASVAEAWGEHAGYVDTRGAAVTERMLELTAPQPGERFLELACGPGSVGIAAAPLVAPGGEVVMSDFVPEMVAIAAARAEQAGLRNVATRVLDLEQIDEPNGAYDVVVCRDGLMLVPDPERGAREIVRVLRPGGRAAVAVWGPRERNPWLSVVFDAVSTQVGAPMPPPGVPHPFSLDDPGRFAQVLSGAGLSQVAVEEVPAPYHAASFEEWWERTAVLAGPLRQRLATLPAEAAGALRARAREASAPYETQAGLVFPGVLLLATASRR
jgi:SAM-dependent methyltransferase